MSREPEYDVLIAGAGPAGAHTALRLAREGWRVAVVDARRFPRKKPCGEFLSPACLPMLDELDLLEPLERAGGARVSGMKLHASASRVAGSFATLGPFGASHGHGVGIRREVLDAQAVEAVRAEPSATVLEGWRVSRVLQEEERVVGLAGVDADGRRRELRARLTIGADGLKSRVARDLGWTRPRSGADRFALVARFEGVATAREAEVHFVGRDYFAACPIDEGLFTANLVVDADAVRASGGGRAGLEQLFHERLERAPALAARLDGATLAEPMAACGPLRSTVSRVASSGVALVGDACGFVDPLTGEGVFFAMSGARLLARAAAAALERPAREASALRGYARARRLELGPRYAVARLLQAGLRIGGLPERGVGLLARVPGLRDVSLAWTGDYLPARALLSPSVWRSALGGDARPAAAG